MKRVLLENARVLWMEGGKGMERPLWIELRYGRIPVLDWEGKILPQGREFRVKTPRGDFFVEIQGEEVKVYFLER